MTFTRKMHVFKIEVIRLNTVDETDTKLEKIEIFDSVEQHTHTHKHYD